MIKLLLIYGGALALALVTGIWARQDIDTDLSPQVFAKGFVFDQDRPLSQWERDRATIAIEASSDLTADRRKMTTMSRVLGEAHIRETVKVASHYTQDGNIAFAILKTMAPIHSRYAEPLSGVERVGVYHVKSGNVRWNKQQWIPHKNAAAH